MIQFGREGPETRLDVAQTFAIGQLRECQAEKLIPTREAARTAIATLSPHTGVEVVPRNEVHELSEHEFPEVHLSSSTTWDEYPGVDSDDPS